MAAATRQPHDTPRNPNTVPAATAALDAALMGRSSTFFAELAKITNPAELRDVAHAARCLAELAETMAKHRRRGER